MKVGCVLYITGPCTKYQNKWYGIIDFPVLKQLELRAELDYGFYVTDCLIADNNF